MTTNGRAPRWYQIGSNHRISELWEVHNETTDRRLSPLLFEDGGRLYEINCDGETCWLWTDEELARAQREGRTE
jgi:hypothetical protein